MRFCLLVVEVVGEVLFPSALNHEDLFVPLIFKMSSCFLQLPHFTRLLPRQKFMHSVCHWWAAEPKVLSQTQPPCPPEPPSGPAAQGAPLCPSKRIPWANTCCGKGVTRFAIYEELLISSSVDDQKNSSDNPTYRRNNFLCQRWSQM